MTQPMKLPSLFSFKPLLPSIVLALLALLVFERWDSWRLGLEVVEGSFVDRAGAVAPIILITAALAHLATVVLQAVMTRRLGGSPSKLVRQLVGFLVWSVASLALAGAVFGVPLGSLLTTSGMMVAVVGIALKNMISDLFAGLSLQVRLGDWLEVDGNLGQVSEISWRSTRMVTGDQITIIIPNTLLMSRTFRNYSQPEKHYREKLRLVLPQSVTAHQVERILLASVNQVPKIAAVGIPSEVRINTFNENGVEWELRYYIPDAGVASGLRYQLQRNVLRNLHYSGVELASKVIELRPQAPQPELGEGGEEAVFLRSIELFECLTDDELTGLVIGMQRRIYQRGDAVVRQGDPGNSLFVLREGLMVVSIDGGNGISTEVGQISPGHFFGEMSLLTGAPRSASVTPLVDCLIYEISSELLAPLMVARPSLAELLSNVLATRQMRNTPLLEAAQGGEEEQRASLAKQILAGVRSFFRLSPMAIN